MRAALANIFGTLPTLRQKRDLDGQEGTEKACSHAKDSLNWRLILYVDVGKINKKKGTTQANALSFVIW